MALGRSARAWLLPVFSSPARTGSSTAASACDFRRHYRGLLAIFAATIVALVARPVPMGVSVVIAMTLLVLTGTLPSANVLSGFSNPTVWLVFTAFLFARAVITTGLGLRIAYLFIRRFGHSALTLGYSLVAADVVLAPFVPSDTARGGGVVYPITRSLCEALDSEPGPTANRIGTFLTLVSFHATYTASAMFLTGMVANPLIAGFARDIGHVDLCALRALPPESAGTSGHGTGTRIGTREPSQSGANEAR